MLLLNLALGIHLAVLAVLSGAVYVLFFGASVHADKLRDAMVEAMGNFLADVLEHPRTQAALDQTLRRGINHTIEQPDLGSRLRKVSEYMAEDNLHMSRTIGEQLPGLAANFVSGAVSSIAWKKKKPNNSVLEGRSKETSIEQGSSLSLGGSDVDADFPGRIESKKAK